MKKILIVDDEPSLLFMIKETLLLEKNFQVIDSNNGTDALDKFSSLNPELVILDVQIPNFSGYNLAKSIFKQNPLTKIIMLSAEYTPEQITEFEKIGVSACMDKPFNPIKLLTYARDLLQ